MVPFASYHCCRDQNVKSRKGKQKGLEFPAYNSVSNPLDDLSQIIWIRYVLKQELVNFGIMFFTRFTFIFLCILFFLGVFQSFLFCRLKNIVRVNVCYHSSNENHCTNGMSDWIIWLLIGQINWSLQEAISQCENERIKSNFEGNFCCSFEGKWINEVSVDVVNDKENEAIWDCLFFVEDEISSPDKVGDLKEEPCEFGIKVAIH